MVRLRLILTLLLLCASAEAQPIRAGKLGERVDAIAERARTRPIAGVSIAIAQDGKIVLQRGYGFANVEHSVAVTPETIFHIASVSKYIEAAVLVQLADQGKLSLDDDVQRYVPDAPVQGHRVTVRQLLNHTSGMHSYTSLPDAELNEARVLSHQDVMNLIREVPFDFEPGTSWRYDNSGFYLAGMIVEKVSGMDYATYVRERLFKPLGMSTASLCDARMIVPHLASGYDVDAGTLVHAAPMTWTTPFAAGSVCATATDLLKWQDALDHGRIVTPASLAQMRTPVRLGNDVEIDYGLGTRLGSLQGHKVVGHTGSGGGFNTVIESFPADKLTVVVLLNTGGGLATSVATQIARAVLDLPESPLADLPVPADELAALPGNYDSDDGAIEQFVRDQKIAFRPAGAPPEGIPLRRQGPAVYAVDPLREIHYVIRDGRALWGTLYVGGLMMDAKRRVP